MKIIVIEDEPLMAEELSLELCKADESIEIVGVFQSVSTCLDYLSKNNLPDLFFSDIQLSDGLSFDIFSQIELTVPVVFCTAFDEYALDAFKANGIDYLLKPFDNKDIKETIMKYKNLTENKDLSGDFKQLISSIERNNSVSKKSLIIHQGQRIYPVKYSEIRIIFLRDGVTYLLTCHEKKHIISHSLDRIEEILSDDFYRVNRQVIIHRDAIGHINSYFARKLLITPVFKIDIDIVVSKANVSPFLRWLESI